MQTTWVRIPASRKTQKALRVPFPLQWGRFLGGGDGSFQVVCRTDLEVDLDKLELVTILSPRVKSLSLQERNMQMWITSQRKHIHLDS